MNRIIIFSLFFVSAISFASEQDLLPMTRAYGASNPHRAISELNLEFLKACWVNDIASVRELMREDSIDFNIFHWRYFYPLTSASLKGYGEVVQLLLESDYIDVYKKDAAGVTALYCACLGGHVEIVNLLLLNMGVIDDKTTAEFSSENSKFSNDVQDLLEGEFTLREEFARALDNHLSYDEDSDLRLKSIEWKSTILGCMTENRETYLFSAFADSYSRSDMGRMTEAIDLGFRLDYRPDDYIFNALFHMLMCNYPSQDGNALIIEILNYACAKDANSVKRALYQAHNINESFAVENSALSFAEEKNPDLYDMICLDILPLANK